MRPQLERVFLFYANDNAISFLFLFFTVYYAHNMSAPKLEDLPKVAVDLKSQLEGFSTDNLKDTITQEKIVLPTAEGMYDEQAPG